MKKISILGATGSIGSTTLSIISKKKVFNLILLSANKNYRKIINQIKLHKPKYYVINDKSTFKKIKLKFKNKKIKILNNFEEVPKNIKFDITISAIPGINGLKPTTLMIKQSKKILIANKESVICGWNLIKNIAEKNKTKIIPIDSEHFSLMQLIQNYKEKDIDKIYLTASGGPFLNFNIKEFKTITPKQAFKHPKWKMGKKISIDSSTMMNKILEVIEAQKIFNLPLDKIDILIHPESLVHAILKLKNGLVKLLYHETSMVIPISNAIFENNLNINEVHKVSRKSTIRNLTFSVPDKNRFNILKIKDKITEYPSTPIIINSANEILVRSFLKNKTSFLSISRIILKIMKDRNYKKYAIKTPSNINQIKTIDNWARKKTLSLINKNEKVL